MPIEPPIGPKPPIGRGWLIDQITALVDRGGLGLLTLTGLPGVGKTTVARCALDRRAHRWIDADDLARRLPPADVVGVGDVVVVDGVTDDEAQRAAIEQLLDRGVRLVATARRPLRVADERIVRVSPLPVPDPALAPEALAAEPTVQLFRHVAVRSGSTPDWDDTELRAVADIARTVGGHPMAIELLAARTPAYSPTTLAEQLSDDRRRGMAHVIDGADELLDTIEWSAVDVGDPAVPVLTALTVFEGPVPIDAIERVTGGRTDELPDVVSDLVDAHLVDAIHTGVSRYALPPLVAEALRHRADDVDDTRHRKARLDWSVTLASDATSTARGETGLPDPRLVAVESDLTATLLDAVDTGHADAAATLVAALAPVWVGRGVLADEVALARRALDLADGTASTAATAIARGWFANLLAERLVVDEELSEFTSQRAASLACVPDVEPGDAVRLLALGVRPGRALADRSGVLELADRGRSIAADLGDHRSVVRFEVWSGMLAHQDGDLSAAVAWGSAALARARQVGDEPGMVAAAGLLRTLPPGHTADLVVPSLVELAGLARRHHDTRTLTWVVPAAASEALAAGDVEQGLELIDESLLIARRAGTWTWYTCPPLSAMATLASARGADEAAATLLGILEAQLDAFESSLPLDLVRRLRASIEAGRGSADPAVRAAFATGTMMSFDRTMAFADDVSATFRNERARVGETDPPAAASALTARELDVLRELANGGTNKDVAAALGIRPKTVMHHAAAIYRKLQVRGRGEAVAWWFRQRP